MPDGRVLHAQVWRAQVGRVPLLLLDSDVEANAPGAARGHRPAVRRRQRPPAAPGDAARHRRRAGDPRLDRAHRRAGARGVPHQRGPRRLPRRRAGPRAGRRRADLRRGQGGGARRHGLHHAHPGARRHRPLPARPDRPLLRRRQRVGPRRPAGRPDPRARRRGRPARVQHGAHGPADGAAPQRRRQAARHRQPRHVRRAVAGLRPAEVPITSVTNGVHAPDLGRPARSSSSPSARSARRITTEAQGWEGIAEVADTRSGASAGCCASGWCRRSAAGSGSPGCSAARPRPSWAGPRRCSTPTCSRSASRGASRRTSA